MRIRPIENIVAQRHRNDCTDRQLYDMIDHIACAYFSVGVVLGFVLALVLLLLRSDA